MTIHFANKASLETLVLAIGENFDIKDHLNIDEELKNLVLQIVAIRKFEGKVGQTVTMATPNHHTVKCLILKGVGDHNNFDILAATKFGGKIISSLQCSKLEQASLILDDRLFRHNKIEIYANIAYGVQLRNYSFDKYKSADKLKNKTIISKIELITDEYKEAQKLYENELKPIAESVYFSRDLISEPPNVIYPESFANRSQEELEKLGIKVEILGEKQMRDLGMNALLGVGQGSIRESKLLIMQYNGGEKGESPVAFVGKGVTFDTGGISLKPASGMEDMKYDMSGAAVVTGVIRGLAARGAKVNVVAVAALTENMPGGNAQRPSDIVRSMSGQTIEVLNTDAEGRLILADALWYCQDRFKPKLMVNLATLTGAMVVSLGSYHAGIFSNNAALEQELLQAGKQTDEKLWPFPLSDDYDKMIDSSVADMRNIGKGKGAGSITAAQFLKRFVNDVAWAHLDIAGVSGPCVSADLHPDGASAFGVRLLNEFIRAYEK